MKRASKAGRFQNAKGVIGSDLDLAVKYLAEGVRERLGHMRPKDILAEVIRNSEREPKMTSNITNPSDCLWKSGAVVFQHLRSGDVIIVKC